MGVVESSGVNSHKEENVATHEYELVDPPTEPRALELWIQHAAGFIFFEDVRRYAIERIQPGLSAEAVAAAKKGIDDAVYGLMMVIDGVTGSLSNTSYRVDIDFIARLITRKNSEDDELSSQVDLLQHGDGMCMGYHGWLEGDYGKYRIATARTKNEE